MHGQPRSRHATRCRTRPRHHWFVLQSSNPPISHLYEQAATLPPHPNVISFHTGLGANPPWISFLSMKPMPLLSAITPSHPNSMTL